MYSPRVVCEATKIPLQKLQTQHKCAKAMGVRKTTVACPFQWCMAGINGRNRFLELQMACLFLIQRTSKVSQHEGHEKYFNMTKDREWQINDYGEIPTEDFRETQLSLNIS